MEDQEKKRQVREAAIHEAVNELKGKVNVGGEEHGSGWRDMAERIEVLDGLNATRCARCHLRTKISLYGFPRIQINTSRPI
jgi:hypothetical protein